MKKKSDILIIALFLIFIYGTALAGFVMKDREFSQMENRTLMQMPELTLADIWSGKFMEDYETYITDQFVARDFFVGMKSLGEKLLGKKINNDVYFAKDGYLIEQFTVADDTLPTRNALAIGKFAKNIDAKVAVALIPGSVEINRDKLFTDIPDESQKDIIDGIYTSLKAEEVQCVDMLGGLSEHKKESIFYHTDHHWTSLGAYYGYKEVAKTLGLHAVELDTYQETKRSDSFYGTLYSKAGAFWLKPDEIITYVEDNGIKVTQMEGATEKDGFLYDLQKLEEKDKYAMFLGGNQPLVKIETKDKEGKLLIIRDSYSDSLAPFLTAHYGEIYLWDFRYNKESVSGFIKENGIDNVLICYSVDNFCEDTNISFVLGRE